jgi:hypothetical protein
MKTDIDTDSQYQKKKKANFTYSRKKNHKTVQEYANKNNSQTAEHNTIQYVTHENTNTTKVASTKRNT